MGANQLLDQWGRQLDYLRIAVTDRCNLRCFYCMPAEGIKYLPKTELLSYEELLRLVEIFGELGVRKVRLTGGEPFARRDMIDFISRISQIDHVHKLHITTNGVLTHEYLDRLAEIGIAGVNLSLDTIDKKRFHEITRRDVFDDVMNTFHGLLERNIKTKINMVVMRGKNDQDILPILNLAKDHKVDVRYIEEMPFNGTGQLSNQKTMNHGDILNIIKAEYADTQLTKQEKNASATSYQIEGFKGQFGIIPAYSRTFCGSCNRIRLTAQGTIRICLYDNGELNLRDHLRNNTSSDDIKSLIIDAVKRKAKDGFEAEKSRGVNAQVSESMSTVGG